MFIACPHSPELSARSIDLIDSAGHTILMYFMQNHTSCNWAQHEVTSNVQETERTGKDVRRDGTIGVSNQSD